MWALQAIGATPSAAYSAAKAGVHALTKNLAIELAPGLQRRREKAHARHVACRSRKFNPAGFAR